MLPTFQEEKLEDDSFPVIVPAEPVEYRLDTVTDSNALPVPQLHLLISGRKLPWLPESYY